MKRQLPSQLLESQFLDPATRNAPLSETIRQGAQLMLQKAIELEVTEFLGRDHYQRHGDSLLRGYRNGYADKRVETGEGPLHLKMPQVRETIEAFGSVWLQSLVRRSDKLAALIPQLYVKGLSTRDIEAALTDALEAEGVSKSTVSTLFLRCCWMPRRAGAGSGSALSSPSSWTESNRTQMQVRQGRWPHS
jgi:putative transposase